MNKTESALAVLNGFVEDVTTLILNTDDEALISKYKKLINKTYKKL